MSGSYSIALSGINAAQTGLDVVSQNIANASTPGYLAEQVNLNPLVDQASQTGDGVTVASVSAVSSQIANNALIAATGTQDYAKSLSQSLGQVQSAVNEPSSMGIAEQLSSFWNAFDQVANNPTQLAPRQQLIAQAQTLASSFNQRAADYVQIYNATTAQIQGSLTTVNSQLQQVAQLNQEILAAGPNPSASVESARNQLVQSLAGELGVTVQSQTDGSINLLAGGIMLVQGNVASKLDLSAPTAPPIPSSTPVQVVVSGSGSAVPVTSGSIGGLMQVTNDYLPSYALALDQQATQLAQQVNSQLTSGSYYDQGSTTPTAGVPLFTFGGNGASLAANLAVSSSVAANPFQIAAAGNPPTGPNDGANAQTLAEMGALSGGVDTNYSSWLGSLGLDVQSAQNLATSAATTYQSAFQNFQGVSGVSTNDQLVKMLNYQQGYQAAAKVISTVSASIQSLLQAV
ncbi:MAG: flagellar hook-associated protein FlgK [Actinomycetota bacterium]|nr:flagellar hook-associated protein FlgK [Actinomycetota bacterium]